MHELIIQLLPSGHISPPAKYSEEELYEMFYFGEFDYADELTEDKSGNVFERVFGKKDSVVFEKSTVESLIREGMIRFHDKLSDMLWRSEDVGRFCETRTGDQMFELQEIFSPTYGLRTLTEEYGACSYNEFLRHIYKKMCDGSLPDKVEYRRGQVWDYHH